MTRNELFDFIRKNDYQEEVKKAFNKNFTNVSTKMLQDFVDAKINSAKDCAVKAKYQKLVDAIASLICSINDEEIANDLKDSIESVKKSLTEI